MTIRLRERVDPTPRTRMALDTGESERVYVLYDDDPDLAPTTADVRNAVTGFLGRTYYSPDDPDDEDEDDADLRGSVARKLPLADPLFPSLFAEDVTVSPPTNELFSEDDNSDELAAPPVRGHARYNGHQLTVRFTMRPFPLFEDERLERRTIDFDGVVMGEKYRLVYFREWLRFGYWLVKPTDTRVSAQAGSAMQFRGIPGATDVPYTAIPDAIIPDASVSFFWFGVPARYVEGDCYLLKFRGFINQTQFLGWGPGNLLYLNPEVVRSYVQPVSVRPAAVGDTFDEELLGTFAFERYVDLVLHFIATARQPGTSYPGDFVPNPNWIVAGHNLMMYFPTRKFYYASSAPLAPLGNNPATWVPSYFSVPYEILFQDPAVFENLTLI